MTAGRRQKSPIVQIISNISSFSLSPLPSCLRSHTARSDSITLSPLLGFFCQYERGVTAADRTSCTYCAALKAKQFVFLSLSSLSFLSLPLSLSLPSPLSKQEIFRPCKITVKHKVSLSRRSFVVCISLCFTVHTHTSCARRRDHI